jgi:hypothetical protein
MALMLTVVGGLVWWTVRRIRQEDAVARARHPVADWRGDDPAR